MQPVLSGDHSSSLLPRYQALLSMADLLVHEGDISDLFRELSVRLKEVVRYELVSFCLYDAEKDVVRVSVWEGSPGSPPPLEVPASEAVAGWVSHHQQMVMVQDIEREGSPPRAVSFMQERKLRSYCVLPLTSGKHRIGALGLASAEVSTYEEKDLDFLQRMANLVALAIGNSLDRQALRWEKERAQILLEVDQHLASYGSVPALMVLVSKSLGRAVPHDYLAAVVGEDKTSDSFRVYQGYPAEPPGSVWDPNLPLKKNAKEFANCSGTEESFGKEQLAVMDAPLATHMEKLGLARVMCLPLRGTKGTSGTLMVGRRAEEPFQPRELALLRRLSSHFAVGYERDRAWHQIAELKDRLAGEKLYLEDEMRRELNVEQIVGESEPLMQALSSARTVAPSDATVLILGETGTGKELVARAIHNLSSRNAKSFIKVNCAAIPTGLLESELFGHERGAFTGALAQKIGRIELADGGTLFLDEVGDIPLELQPKLLRVLQDHEFERLGSTKTLKVNLRIIAATNRDMKRSVDHREFRRDLYYRLNVFPLHVPPLRERRSDIPLLVRYFVQRFARRMNKPIESIRAETMNALMNWDWPGNVRELENFLERSVILSKGPALAVPVSELQPVSVTPGKKDVTLENAEREHIVRVLRETGGVISGLKGAAARLGLKRTTLQSKMQKLRIRREDFEN